VACLSKLVTLAEWKKVCRKALEDAKKGDRYAREWLARYILGEEKPMRLAALAADESAGYSPEDEIERERAFREQDRTLAEAVDFIGKRRQGT
jgi:hypothetical protein